jgi:hypothetical protein
MISSSEKSVDFRPARRYISEDRTLQVNPILLEMPVLRCRLLTVSCLQIKRLKFIVVPVLN